MWWMAAPKQISRWTKGDWYEKRILYWCFTETSFTWSLLIISIKLLFRISLSFTPHFSSMHTIHIQWEKRCWSASWCDKVSRVYANFVFSWGILVICSNRSIDWSKLWVCLNAMLVGFFYFVLFFPYRWINCTVWAHSWNARQKVNAFWSKSNWWMPCLSKCIVP